MASSATSISAGIGALVSVISTIGLPALAAAAGVAAIGAAIVAIGGYVLKETGALDWLKRKSGELRDRWSEILGSMGDAFAAGDLKLAAQIMWAGLKVEWHKGVLAVEGQVIDLKNRLLKIKPLKFLYDSMWKAYELGGKLRVAFITAFEAIKAKLQKIRHALDSARC